MTNSALTRLRNPQRRAVYISRLRKLISSRFRQQRDDTVPVFVLGLQRSGTNMIMDVLHLRDDTEVFSESRENAAFDGYLLRDLQLIEGLIARSWAPFMCFKPISDSHRAEELIERFPYGRFIWIYRQYQDVANSRLRLFSDANRAIRLICRGESGAGWFDRGVSPATRKVLRSMEVDRLSEFDLACLTWWARNNIFVENALWRHRNVCAVRYEKLASDPGAGFAELFEFLDMKPSKNALRFVRKSSIGRHPAPVLDRQVDELCQQLLDQLNRHQR